MELCLEKNGERRMITPSEFRAGGNHPETPDSSANPSETPISSVERG